MISYYGQILFHSCLIHWKCKRSAAVHRQPLECLLTTGCTKTDETARTQTHALFGHSLLSLNKYRGPSIRGDKDAIGNFYCSAVTKQPLDE